mgnify:CR=1 FL=1
MSLGRGSKTVSDNGVSLLANPVISSIAGKHKISNAQVLLRYQVQRGVIVIPKRYPGAIAQHTLVV